MDFDALLVQHVGQWGRGQLLVLLGASAGWATLAVAVLSMVFVTQTPAWHCAAADDAVCQAAAQRQQHDPMGSLCSLRPDQVSFNQPRASLVATFGLACGNRVAWLNAIFFVGYAIGSSIFGWLADTHGRKAALVASCLGTAAVTLLCAASSSYGIYMAGRLLQGLFCSGLPIAAYVLSTESVGPSVRGRAGTASQIIYHVGEWVLPLMALALQDWRLLYVAIAGCCLATAGLALLVPESPRWQLLHGRTGEAVRTLQWLARLNGRQLPDAVVQQLLAAGARPEGAAAAGEAAAGVAGGQLQQQQEDQLQDQDQDSDCIALLRTQEANSKQQGFSEQQPEQQQPEQQPEDRQPPGSGGNVLSHSHVHDDSVWLVLSDPLLARLFWVSAWLCTVMAAAFFTANLATEKLQGSLAWNFFVTSIGELPATVIGAVAVDAVGRRPTIATGLLVTGIACAVCSMLSPGGWSTAMASLGKAACSSTWSLSYIFAAELMPTSVRSAALAGSNQAARLGGAVAPFIIYASERQHHPKMPFALVGGLAAATAALTFCLPETRGKRQPETMADLRQLYFSGGGSSGGGVGADAGGGAGEEAGASLLGSSLDQAAAAAAGRSQGSGVLQRLLSRTSSSGGGQWLLAAARSRSFGSSFSREQQRHRQGSELAAIVTPDDADAVGRAAGS